MTFPRSHDKNGTLKSDRLNALFPVFGTKNQILKNGSSERAFRQGKNFLGKTRFWNKKVERIYCCRKQKIFGGKGGGGGAILDIFSGTILKSKPLSRSY